MAAVQVAPHPPGATSRQAHEAERWQDRYGRCRARVDDLGYLRLDIYGQRPRAWVSLKLGPDGCTLDVQHHDGDPRENGLKPTERRVLAELREDPDRWLTLEQVALGLDVNPHWARTNLVLLADRGLVDVRGRGGDTRYRDAGSPL